MVQFGGLIKFILIVGSVFVMKYNDILFTVELANKLYDFNFTEKKNKKNNSSTVTNGSPKSNRMSLKSPTTI